VTKGYSDELLKVFKKLNPDKTEDQIIEIFQEQRQAIADKMECSINCVGLSINEKDKTIKIDIVI